MGIHIRSSGRSSRRSDCNVLCIRYSGEQRPAVRAATFRRTAEESRYYADPSSAENRLPSSGNMDNRCIQCFCIYNSICSKRLGSALPSEVKGLFIACRHPDYRIFRSVRCCRNNLRRLAFRYGVQGQQGETGRLVRNSVSRVACSVPVCRWRLSVEYILYISVQPVHRRPLLHSRRADGCGYCTSQGDRCRSRNSRHIKLRGSRCAGYSKRISYSGWLCRDGTKRI